MMIRKRSLGLVTGTAAVLAMLLTACAGGGAVAGGGGGAATGEPVSGGSATVLMPNEVRTLDPAKIGNNTAAGGFIGNALYRALLLTDPENGEIVPSMATAFTTDDGGKTFRLTLRDGLTFSDGSPLDAAAVQANWERMRDPETGSLYLSEARLVASTEVTDPATLAVTMAEPTPSFPYSIVTSSLNWIASPAALAQGGQAFDANPVGAGPFTLKEWRRQDATEFVRNPRFWDAPRPYLETLTTRPSSDGNQRFNTVVSGGADVAVEPSWRNLQKAEESGLARDVLSLNGGVYVALNTRTAPFDDPRAREAFAAAIDPAAVNVSAFNGAASLVDTAFTPSSPLHTGKPAGSPDPARAQELFDELAAEGKPVTFTFISSSSTESRSQAEAVQAQLSAFTNVNMEVTTVDSGAIQGLQTSHDFQATISTAAFVDPEPRMSNAFSGDSAQNMTGLDDPEVNALLATGRSATDPAERTATYDALMQRLNELHVLPWLTRTASGAISGTNVGGLAQYGFGSLRADTLWVQP
ncbi:ABC transporter substrate-binding protein [Pseudonocardia parietis]|uniref:Peptide/nickel transport system substrate-binding protein n=1 Tax=Pseudonocardia parietis TaxID=570936 RepID=A0ABS4VYM0_9PSEU|nr:ABC transporter substrate-binding protein [Pseudonocardia parietis]MBP2368891.1 peptide/nickel transport system substrate-binding protein [Pseudonocardia parietis]